MKRLVQISKYSVAAFLLFFSAACLVVAQETEESEKLDLLFWQLQDVENANWKLAEDQIWKIWTQSGSDSVDFLLQRGHQAMSDGDLDKAVEHLTAVIDHAPEFAEGWNARATAYFLQNNFGPSIADIQQTLVRNPRHFGAMSGLAQIFMLLDEPENALKAYRAALALHPRLEGAKEAVERLEKLTEGTSL